MPKVSVIVPVFGVEKYIERCARSLFEQTLDDIEYLFIDDCSLDRSIEILQQVLEEYPQRKLQVVIHRMEQNSGQAAVRKWGMQNATGEYVIHCDPDDWVDTDMYRAMYEKAKNEGAYVVVCDYYINSGSDNTYVNAFERTDKKGFIEDMLAQRVSWALWNKMAKRDECEILFPEGNMGEDMVIIIQYLLKSRRTVFERRPYYYYVINPSSITQIKDKKSIIKKYTYFLDNCNIIIPLLDEVGNISLNHSLVALKWAAKRLLWLNIKKYDLFQLWRNTYKEINVKLLFCPLISFSDKIKYILTYIKLYPTH